MIKRNPMIMLMVACGIAFFFILFVVNTKPTEEPSSQNTGEEVQSTHVETAPIEPIIAVASEKQAQALQAFQDSPLDTLRTLNAAYEQSEADKAALAKALETTQQTMAKQNAQSSEEVDALKGQLSELTERLNESLSIIEDKVSQSRDALRDRQEPVRESMGTDYDELGLDSGRQDGRLTTGTSRLGYADEGAGDGLIWTEPLDATQDEDGNWLTPATQALTATVNDAVDDFDRSGQSVTKKQGTPVYTLHRGAMLANAVSMTALMGRIPLNGQLTDPYPFSMIVGRENLLANGFTLPDVQGAIVTGTASGDWSLSCVRGVVESMDFIRADGSILSYPETEETIDSGFDGSEVKTKGLGFLADPNGNPCLTGERISNAPEYLTTQGLLNASTAAANAAAIAQQTVSVDGSTTTSSMTGNAAKNAAAESAAAFTSTVSDFIQARMGSSFDIIYTPPGTAASIHLRQPITLRIPEEPVRVRYDAEPQGVTYALP
ncbi:TIGR03752 family integrating conjugative element protein [Vibrio parahaemolyticus]|uniref:TIGR03752 family integrating conjugative element protein n=1 Tax=Vibrio parahaemolyticus TaxID=670 RepID=UPI00215B9E90|nr:TIGR03752 family integrating conjugative element protein [Vibrio parahaemolyticus]MCR9780685.1 TIGR03752 family integrating conjugative element protein [Vibrio parahaemolyticus]